MDQHTAPAPADMEAVRAFQSAVHALDMLPVDAPVAPFDIKLIGGTK